MDEDKVGQYSQPKLFPEAKIDVIYKLCPFFEKYKQKEEVMFIFGNYIF